MRRRSCGWRAAAMICTCALAGQCHGAWSRLEGSLNAYLKMNDPRGGGRGLAGAEEEEVEARCALTTGTWCRDYLLQKPIPTKAPPHGNRTCLNDCNGLAGVCNYDTGLCHCIAGWHGDYCEMQQKRPCTNSTRSVGWEVLSQASPDDKGWTASRCSGVCDDDRAICYCDGKYGRQPAPSSKPAGSPPVREGRPMPLHCMPTKNSRGEVMGWKGPTWEEVHGPEGWCQTATPKHRCLCLIDGVTGDFCDIPTEHFCLNQCTGHGDCIFGFCRCHPGYYGHDCARRAQGFPDLPGDQEVRPWLTEVIVVPQGIQDPTPVTQRLRPLIYVYDLPPIYNVRMLEYRVDKLACATRMWKAGNRSEVFRDPGRSTYLIEQLLHEALLQSEHRTLDAEEADYFYVPVYASCFAHPVHGWADHPWFPGPANRVMQMSRMTLEAKRWIENHLSWWKRRGGADHIWLFSHDEGACWAPREIYETSVILTHWGRKDLNPVSNTAFEPDNYTKEQVTYWQPGGYKHIIGGHPCYDPKKNHLVIPAAKGGGIIGMSPLIGNTPMPRTILMSFRGSFRDNKEGKTDYGRGIRARVRRYASEGGWWAKYNITIENDVGPRLVYGELLMRSIFCLVAPGDGWSPRAEDAILHGCIPVLVMDHVDPIFAGLLDWSAFSIRIREDDLDRIPDILTAIPEQRRTAMLEAVGKVWKRFLYGSVQSIMQEIKEVSKDLTPLPYPVALPASPHSQSEASSTSPEAGGRPRVTGPEPQSDSPQEPEGHNPPKTMALIPHSAPGPKLLTGDYGPSGSLEPVERARYGAHGAEGGGKAGKTPYPEASGGSLETVDDEHAPAAGKDRAKVRVVARLWAGSSASAETAGPLRELGVDDGSPNEIEQDVAEVDMTEGDRAKQNEAKLDMAKGDMTKTDEAKVDLTTTLSDRAPKFTEEDLVDWLDEIKQQRGGAESDGTRDGEAGRTFGSSHADTDYVEADDADGSPPDAQRVGKGKRRRPMRQKRKAGDAVVRARLPELASGREPEGAGHVEMGEVEVGVGPGRRELMEAAGSNAGFENIGIERVANVAGFSDQEAVEGWSNHARTLTFHNSFADASPPNTYTGELRQDDAMATIMAWLYERIPATRGP